MSSSTKEKSMTAEEVDQARHEQFAAALAGAETRNRAADSLLPERDDKGRLTTTGIHQVLDKGGSVMGTYGKNGAYVHITHKGMVPSEAELALGNETAENDAIEAIENRRKQLDREEKMILDRRADANKSKRGRPRKDKGDVTAGEDVDTVKGDDGGDTVKGDDGGDKK